MCAERPAVPRMVRRGEWGDACLQQEMRRAQGLRLRMGQGVGSAGEPFDAHTLICMDGSTPPPLPLACSSTGVPFKATGVPLVRSRVRQGVVYGLSKTTDDTAFMLYTVGG